MSLSIRPLCLVAFTNPTFLNKHAKIGRINTNGYFTYMPRNHHVLKRQALGDRGVHQKLLGKYLFLTNTISSSLLMALGDFIQQKIECYRNKMKTRKYNYRRTINMAIIGLALGPVQHFLYKYIDLILPKKNIKSVLKKILIDQSICSALSTGIFFYGLGLLEDGNLKHAHEEFKNKFWKIYLVDWCVWPPCQFLNFSYIPGKYRVVYINTITMLYNVFLSYIKHEVPHKSANV